MKRLQIKFHADTISDSKVIRSKFIIRSKFFAAVFCLSMFS